METEHAPLTEEDRRQINDLRKHDVPYRLIADVFDVATATAQHKHREWEAAQ